MPTWLWILIGAFVLLVVVLATAGIVLVGRRERERTAEFEQRVAEANRALAAAHAADKGWEPATVEAAARRAFAEQRPGVEVRDVRLVQVVDPPGTEEDKAVFSVTTADGHTATLALGRRDGEWVPESLA
jgi:hypothetical protein